MTLLKRLAAPWQDLDPRALVICFWAPIALTLIEYYFIPQSSILASTPALVALSPWGGSLTVYFWWVGGNLCLAAFLPALWLWLFTGTSPRAIGLRLGNTFQDAKIYFVLYFLLLPFLYFFSTQPSFRQTYPFFHPAHGIASADFLGFELLYFLQFLTVEFFFRGFLVLGLKPSLGRYSILVALAPYCMIHFHKPLPEALGAIGAGFILGSLAWQTETVIYGWFLHYAVALTMDLLALRG